MAVSGMPAELARLLGLAHRPGPQMLEAAEQLRLAEAHPGFGPALLQLVSNGDVAADVRQAGCIYFKNFVKRRWLGEPGALSDADRELLKDAILPSLLPAPRPLRSQFCAALEEMALADFPKSWPGLLQGLVRSLEAPGSPDPLAVRAAAMEAAHAVFGRFRAAGRCREFMQEARGCADAFGLMHLTVWREACSHLIERNEHALAPDQVLTLLDLLTATANVFYDLNASSLPAFFGENRDAYFRGSLALLGYRSAVGEAAAGPYHGLSKLDLLKIQVCNNLALYASQYEEEFQTVVGDCLKATWDLLMTGPSDGVIAAGLSLMSAVASRDWASSPLKDESALQAIVETVVLPNMQLLPSDVILFWEEPREYLCRDLEGADQETRRRAAIDLVSALRREHHTRVSATIVNHVSRLLEQAKMVAEEQEVLCKDACVHMVIALGGSVAANTAPDLSVLEGFFSALVAPELNAEPKAARAVLRAACVKYVTAFRSRLPVASVVSVLPGILRHALAESPVVHTSAVHCFSGLIPLQESVGGSPPQRRRRFDAQVLKSFAMQLVQPVLQILLDGRGIPQNEHLAHALVLIFDFLELRSEGVAEVAAVSLSMLAKIAVTGVPAHSSPEYRHDVFECVAIVLKGLAPVKPEEAEAIILPVVGQLWERRDEDSLSYCFQILGLLLDLTPSDRVKAFHGEIFQKILGEELWRAPGYVPALVRLLRGYFAKHCVFGDMIRGHMQVVFQRFHFAMLHRKLKSSALGLMSAIFRYLPIDFYQPYLQVAISLVLTELQTRKEPYLQKEFAVTLSLLVHVQHDPEIVPQVMEAIQPGLFHQFITESFLPGASRVLLLQRRKICVLGLAKLMGSEHICKKERLLLSCCENLVSMLRSRDGGGLLCWLSALLSTAQEDEPVPGQEFEISFRRLRHTELAAGGGLWDPVPEFQDTPAIMAAVRAALAPLQPAILSLGDGSKPLVELLQKAG